MAYFRDLSIRKKLTFTLMGITSVAVLATCVALYGFIINHYQDEYINDIESLAKVIGYNCQASLMFDVSEDAVKTLQALENKPSIISAAIYDGDHNLFATYGETTLLDYSLEDTARSDGSMNQQESLHHMQQGPRGTILIHQDIFMNSQKIGCISLLDDMRSITRFRNMALFTLALIFLLTITVTFFISVKLREIISKPISDLAYISQKISDKQDFSLRALKFGNDEVGHLVDTFNRMLEQISERSRELEKSEQRFRSLVDQAVDAFFLHDLEGNIIDVNKRACDILGYSREELLSMTVENIDHEADNEAYRNKYWSEIKANAPVSYEGTHVRKDGSMFPVEIREGLMELGDKKVILALARDMTERLQAEHERNRLENQLQQAQKMESIGTLAAGIAHDFNNILSPIYGYVELAQMKVEKDSVVMNYLKEVQSAAHRAGDLVKQILTFSRQDTEKYSPVEVHVIIKEALKLLRATIPTTIEIKQQIEQHCGYVLANPTQIHQVLMNLCTNAYHAMRETGGVLGVSLTRIRITPEVAIQSINLKPGNYLLLEVSDTGTGMDQQILARIFEPYFTTKVHGEGTGMGLSVVHGIIKSHGGAISAYSEPGRGSNFKVYLPVIEEIANETDIVPEDAIATGTEKILLVDDEKSVINVESEMLRSLGYQVVAYLTPHDALEEFIQHPDEYDLVITDMTMPKMTGDKFAMEIMAIRPHIPVIMCTGFSELINKEEAEQKGIRKFVTKPIAINSFARTVREVIDRNRTP